MLIIFCGDPLQPRQPDSMYANEYAAAQAAGFTTGLLDFEALVDAGDAPLALRRLPAPGSIDRDTALYRGWMLKVADYERLYVALAERDIDLITTPAAYRLCHYLPAAYTLIAARTPATVWLADPLPLDFDRIMALLTPFGAAPVIVKDYVKSRKHEWAEACYIPSAADRPAVERVVRRFVALQGSDLTGGLVFRAFVSLEPLATHSKSGMPLTREYRLFWCDGQLLSATAYWEEGDYGEEVPPAEQFAAIARTITSRLFTMDIARRTDGEWIIVELGDGQVAGLPDRLDVTSFYTKLAACLGAATPSEY